MLTSSERKDHILRMIEQVQQLVQRLIGRGREGDAAGALEDARAAVRMLLGPLADVAPRLDSVTAAHMVADADALEAWASVVAEEAELRRLDGDEASARAAERRALELALEAHLRATADRPPLIALVHRLAPRNDAATLDARHADALAAISPAES